MIYFTREVKVDTRTIKLCMKLLSMNQEVSLEQLASSFDVSVRTIRNDISRLNNFLEMNCLPVTTLNLGYVSLIVDKRSQIFERLDNLNFYEYRLDGDERKIVILLVLLVSDKHIIMDHVAEIMSVSRTTIVKDFYSLTSIFTSIRNHIESIPAKGFKLVGLTLRQKMEIFTDLLLNETDLVIRFFNQERAKSMIKISGYQIDEVLHILEQIVLDVQKTTNQYLTKQSNIYLIYYLLYSLINSLSNESVYQKSITSTEKYSVFEVELIDRIENELCININCSFVYYRTFNKLKFIQGTSNHKNIVQTQVVTSVFIENVSSSLGVDLTHDYILFENLANHISSIIDNPISESEEYDTLFETMEEFNNKNFDIEDAIHENIYLFTEHINRRFSELEVLFILIYIASALERKKNDINDIKMLVVCNSGVGTSQLIRNRIKQTFNLIYCEVVTSYLYKEFLDYNDVDLIVSTVEMEFEEVPYVIVSPALLNEEIIEIAQKMDIIKFQKLRESRPLIEDDNNRIVSVKKYLRNYFFYHEDLLTHLEEEIDNYFKTRLINTEKQIKLTDLLIQKNIETQVEAETWQEAIHKGADILLRNGSIDSSYIDEIIRNFEEFGAYSVIAPGFLVSHAGYKVGTNRLDMSLIKLKRPINFMDSKLNPIRFILTFSPIDGKLHLKAFFNLVNAVQTESFFQKLNSVETSQSIHKLFINYEKERVY